VSSYIGCSASGWQNHEKSSSFERGENLLQNGISSLRIKVKQTVRNSVGKLEFAMIKIGLSNET